MSIVRNLVASFLFLVSVLFNSSPVFSEENTMALTMGMLDVNWVTRQSLLAKDIARQISAKRTKFMTEIKKEENYLRKIDDELQKKRVILSPEAFAEETRNFRSKTTVLRKKVQIRNQELAQFRARADEILNKEIQKALLQVTKKDKLNLVFRYTPELILVRPDALDISGAVLNVLNKNISKFFLPIPANKTGK